MATSALRRLLDDVVGQLEPLRDEHARHGKAEELRQMRAPRRGVEREEVGHLRLAEHLQPLGDEALRRSPRARAPGSRCRRRRRCASSPCVPGTRSSSSRSRTCSKISPTRHRWHLHPISARDGATRARDRGARRSRSAARSQVNVSAKRRACTPSRATSAASPAMRPIAAAIARDVAVRDEISRLAVAHRLTDAGRVRRDDRRAARRRLEIRDPPPFLRRGEDERPRAPQQAQLLRPR